MFVPRPITAENRHHDTMHGGWGPHLRGLMRAGDDALWFTVDAGEDVDHNRKVRYFRRGADEESWSEQAENLHAAGVQQTAASILVGDTIFTYAVDIGAHRLEECTLVLCHIRAFRGLANETLAGGTLEEADLKLDRDSDCITWRKRRSLYIGASFTGGRYQFSW